MPSRVSKKLPLLILTVLVSTATGRAATPTIVHVDLMDPSTSPSVKDMTIKADEQSVKAGPVTFMVSNDSRNLVHEMIVVSVDKPDAPLPYDKKDDRVIEVEDQGSRRSVGSGPRPEEDSEADVEAGNLSPDVQSADIITWQA